MQQGSENHLIFPHLAFLAGNLPKAAKFLQAARNAYSDLAPGNYFYAELARKPDEAAKFFTAYSHRILFGSDGFFFPYSQTALPGDHLKVHRRGCRLYDFLSNDGIHTVENPYPLTQIECTKPCPHSRKAPIGAVISLDILNKSFKEQDLCSSLHIAREAAAGTPPLPTRPPGTEI